MDLLNLIGGLNDQPGPARSQMLQPALCLGRQARAGTVTAGLSGQPRNRHGSLLPRTPESATPFGGHATVRRGGLPFVDAAQDSGAGKGTLEFTAQRGQVLVCPGHTDGAAHPPR